MIFWTTLNDIPTTFFFETGIDEGLETDVTKEN
jgi:hypothetical protein